MNIFEEKERRIYALICRRDGILASDIAKQLKLQKKTVNQLLYGSALLREMCYRDDRFLWHGLIRQTRPHLALYDYCGYYSTVGEFMQLSQEAWMQQMTEGCNRVARNLNDTRGVLHSFRDCRQTMHSLFSDLSAMGCPDFRDWEIAFELRINRARYIRIYADVLVITQDRVFSLEFKMKDKIESLEVIQAAKYTPYLQVIFGPEWEVIPALVLTAADELFEYVPIGNTDAVLPVCAGNMLFNVFDEYLRFLQ